MIGFGWIDLLVRRGLKGVVGSLRACLQRKGENIRGYVDV